MVTRDQDAFHGKRSTYRIIEPLLAFYHAIMRPDWTDLERPGHAEQVWSRAQATFRSKVLGPHFEQLARTWTRWHAAPESLGGQRSRVISRGPPWAVSEEFAEIVPRSAHSPTRPRAPRPRGRSGFPNPADGHKRTRASEPPPHGREARPTRKSESCGPVSPSRPSHVQR